ncbi:MAG: M20/M25/M40 family metallo-hydrolase [Firmicutes bacterium]|jgi:acetylornithine deacetylase/succinyl-diaminopimelate desuccinylase-like protein|nr:M20/M25/M40 family metallo-hydrolase [Bacillota bacterium]
MEKVFDFIDKSGAIYVKELQELLRQPSISTDPDGIMETVAIVKGLLEGISRHVEIIQPYQGGAPILYAKISGETGKTIVFYNHYDVRPPGPLSEWDYLPFSATIDAGKIYARGAADGKGDLVARVKAVEAFIKVREALPLTVKFIVEGEARIGSPALVWVASRRQEIFHADACIYATGSRDDEGRLELTFANHTRPANSDSESQIASLVCDAVTEFYQRDPLVSLGSRNINPVIRIVSQLGIPPVGLSIANNDSRAADSNENINTADFVDGIKLTAAIMHKLAGGGKASE